MPLPPNARRALALPIGAALWTWSCHPASWLGLYENTLLRTLLLAVAFDLYAGRAHLSRMVGPQTRTHWTILAGIVAAGAVLRFGMTPLPFHAGAWMWLLVDRVANEPTPTTYADGYGVFMRLFTLFGLSPEHAIFLGNRVAGLLAPAALYLVARALKLAGAVGLWAAFLLAILPLHIRLSASETMQLIPTLFLLAAVVGFCGHARWGSRALLAVGVCSFTYAVLTRPEASVVVIALPLAYASEDGRRHLRDGWLWGGALTALALGLPLVWVGLTPGPHPLTTPGEALTPFARSLFMAGQPHILEEQLALAGFTLAFVMERRWVVWLPLVAILGTQVVVGFDNNPANGLQLLCGEFPWILLGTASFLAAGVAITSRQNRWIQGAVTAVIAGFFCLQATRAPFFSLDWDMHQEWRFLERTLPAITMSEPRLPVIRLLRSDLPAVNSPSLPDYKLSGVPIGSVADLITGRIRTPAIFYRGLDCFERPDRRYLPGDHAGTEISDCLAVEQHFQLTPLAVTRVDAPSYWSDGEHLRMEIGFFRVDDRPTR